MNKRGILLILTVAIFLITISAVSATSCEGYPSNDDCWFDDHCTKTGVCRSPGYCSGDLDCKSLSQECIGGKCACNDNSYCFEPSEKCESGGCVALSWQELDAYYYDACFVQMECGPDCCSSGETCTCSEETSGLSGDTCTRTACRINCDSIADCGSDEHCTEQNYCQKDGVCSVTEECNVGGRCISGKCSCSSDAGCSSTSERCDLNSGRCVAFAQDSCSSNLDCLSEEVCTCSEEISGLVSNTCTRNTCRPKCSDTADCAMDEYCSLENYCVKDGTCSVDNECATHTCSGKSKCVCSSDVDCSSISEKCDLSRGLCVASLPGICHSNLDCPDYLACYQGKCLNYCGVRGVTCQSPYVCLEDRCQVSPTCSTNAGCPTGMECWGNECHVSEDPISIGDPVDDYYLISERLPGEYVIFQQGKMVIYNPIVAATEYEVSLGNVGVTDLTGAITFADITVKTINSGDFETVRITESQLGTEQRINGLLVKLHSISKSWAKRFVIISFPTVKKANIATETLISTVNPACSDGLDNDDDGFKDINDPDCISAEDTSENTGSGFNCEENVPFQQNTLQRGQCIVKDFLIFQVHYVNYTGYPSTSSAYFKVFRQGYPENFEYIKLEGPIYDPTANNQLVYQPIENFVVLPSEVPSFSDGRPGGGTGGPGDGSTTDTRGDSTTSTDPGDGTRPGGGGDGPGDGTSPSVRGDSIILLTEHLKQIIDTTAARGIELAAKNYDSTNVIFEERHDIIPELNSQDIIASWNYPYNPGDLSSCYDIFEGEFGAFSLSVTGGSCINLPYGHVLVIDEVSPASSTRYSGVTLKARLIAKYGFKDASTEFLTLEIPQGETAEYVAIEDEWYTDGIGKTRKIGFTVNTVGASHTATITPTFSLSENVITKCLKLSDPDYNPYGEEMYKMFLWNSIGPITIDAPTVTGGGRISSKNTKPKEVVILVKGEEYGGDSGIDCATETVELFVCDNLDSYGYCLDSNGGESKTISIPGSATGAWINGARIRLDHIYKPFKDKDDMDPMSGMFYDFVGITVINQQKRYCVRDSECESGEICGTQGYCEDLVLVGDPLPPPPPSPECSTNSECSEGQICDAGTCTTTLPEPESGCTPECGKGEECVENLCVKKKTWKDYLSSGAASLADFLGLVISPFGNFLGIDWFTG